MSETSNQQQQQQQQYTPIYQEMKIQNSTVLNETNSSVIINVDTNFPNIPFHNHNVSNENKNKCNKKITIIAISFLLILSIFGFIIYYNKIIIPQQNLENEKNILKSALEKQRKELTKDYIADLHELIKINPNSQPYLNMLAFAYIEQKNYDEGGKYLQKSIEINKENLQHIIFQQAVKYQNQKRISQAIYLYETHLKINTDQEQTLINLARAHSEDVQSEQYNLQKAKNYLNQCKNINPNNKQCYFYLSKILFTLVSYEEAQKELDSSINLDRYYTDALFLQGQIMLKQNDYNEALRKFFYFLESSVTFQEDLKNLVEFLFINSDVKINNHILTQLATYNNKYSAGFQMMGNLYSKQNRLSDALIFYTKFLEYSPEYLYTLQVVAEGYLIQNKSEEAFSYLEKINLLEQNNEFANFHIGQYYLEKQDYDKAKNYFYIVRYNNPQYPKINKIIGLCEYKTQQINQSLIDLKGYLQNEDNNDEEVIVAITMMQEEDNEAISWANKCLKLHPKQIKCHQKLGGVYYKQEQYNLAIKHLKDYLILDSKDDDEKENVIKLSNSYYFMNQCKLAIPLYEGVFKNDKYWKHSDEQYNLGECYKNEKEFDKAIKQFSTLDGNYYGYKDAKFQIGLIYEIKGDIELASSYYRQYNTFNEDPKVLLKLAEIESKGMHAQSLAVNYYERYIKASKIITKEAYDPLINLYKKYQLQDQAIKFFTQQIKNNPKDELAISYKKLFSNKEDD